MRRSTGAAIALVVGAVEILDLRIALIEVKVKVATAIGADQQAGKHIVFPVVGATLADFAPFLLHLLIHSTLDDRLMDVLEHHPILTVIVDPLLILVGLGISFEIENVTTVFLQGENFGYCGAVPLGRLWSWRKVGRPACTGRPGTGSETGCCPARYEACRRPLPAG